MRNYFGQYEEGEERPAVAAGAEPEAGASATETPDGTDVAEEPQPAESSAEQTTGEESSMTKTPEELLAEERGNGEAVEVEDLSTEQLAEAEEAESGSDAYTDADAREEKIKLDNDAVDTLVDQAQELSDEGIDTDGHDRG